MGRPLVRDNMKKQGFSLAELLIVVLIIGILTAVAVPAYKKAVFRSYLTQGMPLAQHIAKEAEIFYMANGRWPYIDELGVKEKETAHYSVYCANGNGEEADKSNCGLVAVSGRDPYYGGIVTIFISNLPDKVWEDGSATQNYKHLCIADTYRPIAAFTKSICLSFGGKPISDMAYVF